MEHGHTHKRTDTASLLILRQIHHATGALTSPCISTSRELYSARFFIANSVKLTIINHYIAALEALHGIYFDRIYQFRHVSG